MARHDLEDRSVSLIVFLTDGKPTVGETHTLKILNNTREAARGRVCIFTVGIGDDVDFRLLEKLSLENCGFTRRVHEDEDAGAQLIGSARGSWRGEGGTQRGCWDRRRPCCTRTPLPITAPSRAEVTTGPETRQVRVHGSSCPVT